MASLINSADTLRANLMLNKRFSRILFSALAFFLFVLFLTWQNRNGVATLLPILADENDKIPEFYPFETTSDFFPVQIDAAGKTVDELCQTFPKHILKTIQPVLKMGHGENRAKIEAQLDSVSACFDKDDLLIYSDLEETIRGHHVHDILADLPASYYVDNPDFQHYIWQKEMQANGTLDHDKAATGRINGWILDKYKFLPMIERAWKTKPNRDFYFFYETDTYVFWDNVFRFLQTFDPDRPLYMGSPSPGRQDEKKNVKTYFANGGPGFVLSRGAIKELLHRRTGPTGQYLDPPLTQKWLPLLKPECCGDSVIGWALWNVSVPLQGYWPLFNPHPLHGIPYSDLYWCQPVLTLHKTTPEDMPEVWKWEFGRRELGRPLTYSDLWHFRHPGHPDLIDNWDNGDWDGFDAPPEAKVDSFEACGNYCKEHDNCVQYAWQGRDKQKCIAMRSIRYGRSRSSEKIIPPEKKDENGTVIPPPDDEPERWIDFKAGWITERVDQFIQSRNCSAVHWVGPSITRIF